MDAALAAPPTGLDFALLFAALPAPHAVLAPADGRVLALNDALRAALPAGAADRLTGQPLAALLAAGAAAGIGLAPPPAWEAALARLRADPAAGAQVLEESTATPGGAGASAARWWQATLQAVGGVPARYVLVRWLDVSEQRRLRAVGEQSQEELRFLTENLPHVVWVAAPDGAIEYANGRWTDYTGLGPADTLGHAWLGAVHPADRAATEARWAASLVSGQDPQVRYRLRGRDGRYRWYLSRAHPLRDPATGQVRRWYGSLTDVHEQVLAERHERRRDQRLLRQLDQLPVHLVLLRGPELTVDFASARSRDFLDFAASRGKPAREATPPPPPPMLALLEAVYRTGQPEQVPALDARPLDAPDGPADERLIEYVLQPTFDVRGQVDGVLVSGLDVTDKVRSERAAARAAAEVAREREQFRFLTESIPQLVWTADAHGVPDYHSPRLAEFAGAPATGSIEERRRLWGALVHPDDYGPLRAAWQAAVAQSDRGGLSVELRLRRAGDAHYRWFLAQAVPERDPATGAVRKWYGSFTDIDAQKQWQAQLAAKDEQQRRILSQTPAVISVVEGPEHRYVFTNSQFNEFVDHRVELGRTVAECLPEAVEQGSVALLDQVYRTGEPFTGYEVPVVFPGPAGGPARELYADFSYQPLRGDDGQVTGVLAFVLDVTERVRARQQAESLRATARRQAEELRVLADTVPSFVYRLLPSGEVTYLNQTFYAHTGLDAAAPLNAGWDKVHPDDLASARESFLAAAAAGRAWEAQFRMYHVGEARYRWHHTRATPQLDPATGAVRSYSGATADIDDTRTLQDELRRSERRYRFLADSVPLFLWTAEPDGRIDYVNAPMLRYVGGPDARFENWNGDWLAQLHPDDRAAADAAWRQSLATARPYEVQYRLRSHAGEYRWVLVRAQPLYNSQGELIKWYGSGVDVHEQRMLQQELQASEAKFRFLTNAVPIYIWTAEPTGEVDFANEPMLRYLAGPGTADFGPWYAAQGGWTATLHPDDAAAAQARWDKALRTGQDYRAQYRLRGADGEYRWVLSQARPLRDAAGQVLKWYGSSVDIQAQRELLDEVRRAQENFTALANNLDQLAWMAEPDGHIFWYNQRWYDYTGTDLAAMQGWGWETVHHPDHVAGVVARWQAHLAAGEPWEDTFPLRSAAGEYRWFLSRARPIRDAAGNIERWFGSNTDVTELRELQNELRQSEEELRIQAESIPQQVWTAGPDGVVDFYNRRAAAYLGEAPTRPRAEAWANRLHPDDRAAAGAAWARAVETGHYYQTEFRVRRYDGEYRWFLAQAQPYRQPGGPVLKWYGTNTDVHELHELQAALLRREQQFRFLAESVPQLVWTATADGQNDYVNDRWVDYTGLSQAESVGQARWAARVLHPDDQERTFERWSRCIETGAYFEIEYRLRRRDGEFRWFLGQGRPLRDEATGRVLKWFGTCTDIHDVKQNQQLLERQNAQLIHINQDLDNFVYTASHDLKQPIDNMAGIFEELTRTAYFRDPEAVKLMDYFERALGQINQTINDLTAIVQVQRQQQVLPLEQVPLQPLAEEVIASVHDQVKRLGATFELDFARCGSVPYVRANLQSLLFNLISNALKYAHPDRAPHVRLACAPNDAGHPVLTVQDNGLGMDLERVRPQLFQQFARFHTHVEGSGMGLYLVNRIVQSHGGRLEVESEVDQGTTFTVWL